MQVLSTTDVLVLSEVYAAGETPIAATDGRSLADAVCAHGQVDPVFVEDIADMPATLLGLVRDGDVVLTMGAGSISAVSLSLAQPVVPLASVVPQKLVQAAC